MGPNRKDSATEPHNLTRLTKGEYTSVVCSVPLTSHKRNFSQSHKTYFSFSVCDPAASSAVGYVMAVRDRRAYNAVYTRVTSAAACAAYCTGTCVGYSYSTYAKKCLLTDKTIATSDLVDKRRTILGWTHYYCGTSTSATTTTATTTAGKHWNLKRYAGLKFS